LIGNVVAREASVSVRGEEVFKKNIAGTSTWTERLGSVRFLGGDPSPSRAAGKGVQYGGRTGGKRLSKLGNLSGRRESLSHLGGDWRGMVAIGFVGEEGETRLPRKGGKRRGVFTIHFAGIAWGWVDQ